MPGENLPNAHPVDAAFYNGDHSQEGFSVKELFSLLNEATVDARLKLQKLQESKDKISIGDMFEMQMLMNHLSQLSEMSTSVVSASHQAIFSMARNLK